MRFGATRVLCRMAAAKPIAALAPGLLTGGRGAP